MAKLIRYRELQPLPCESRWFVPYRILPGVTAIFEPCHFQEVASFLIEGSRCALLFDSGMGLGNIKAVVDALTNKPVTLVNSHSHFDHVGGNWQFGETHLLNVPEAVRKLENGFSLPEDDENRSPEALHLSCRPWFDLARFCVRPCRVVPIQEGDRFDLGGRTLRVLATPGHSRDGIMLADDANRILFTGDTVYPAPLYAFLEGPEQIPAYAATVSKLAEDYASYQLCCSHNNPLWDGAALCEIAEAFRAVLSGQAVGQPDGGHTRYPFGDFAIVV